MYGLSTEIVKPGAHLRDLMRHRRHTGSFSGDVDEFCARVMQNIALGRIDQTTMQSADGRSFLAISKPLAHGGWVATMEDITERRKLEQERDRNQAFLSEIIDHIPSQITVKSVHDRRYLLLNRVADAQFGISRDLVVGKTAFEVFPKASADIILADEEKAPQSPDGLFKGEHVWESQAKGKSYITSKRLVIRDSAGAPSHVVNVVDDVRHAT